MDRVDVSVVVINYNTFDLTCRCLDSIYIHTYSIEFEIILVDNASTERNPDDFKERFPGITLIRSPENVGFAKGNNMGIEISKGRHVLLLNSDALLTNNVCLILREFLSQHMRVAAVTAVLHYPDGSLQHNCQRFPSVRYKLFELLRLQKVLPRWIAGRILLGPFFDYRSTVFPDWIWGTCFMFKKALLVQLKSERLADEFFMYGEDVQWCMEFRKIGYRVAFDPSAKVIHLMGKSGGAKASLMEKNMNILLQKYCSPFERYCIRKLDRWLV